MDFRSPWLLTTSDPWDDRRIYRKAISFYHPNICTFNRLIVDFCETLPESQGSQGAFEFPGYPLSVLNWERRSYKLIFPRTLDDIIPGFEANLKFRCCFFVFFPHTVAPHNRTGMVVKTVGGTAWHESCNYGRGQLVGGPLPVISG